MKTTREVIETVVCTLIGCATFLGLVIFVGTCSREQNKGYLQAINACVATGRSPAECRVSMERQ